MASARSWSLVYAELIELPDPMAQAIQILETARGIARQGVPVTVNARLLRSVDVPESLRAILGPDLSNGLHVDPLLATQKGLAGLQYRARLFRRLFGAGPETVFYGRSRRHTLEVLRVRRLLRSRARVFYEFHNIESEVAKESADASAEARIRSEEQEICRESDGIASISEPMADDLRDLFGLESRPTVIPDGVAADALARRGTEPFQDERVRIVYAGSLYAYKGVDQLFEMLACLPTNFELTIVGGQGPDDLARLKRLVESNETIANRVRFTGMVAPSAIAEHLWQADLAVLPPGNSLKSSRYTSPLKLFEAMAAGLPVIAAPVPALTSVLEHGTTGWIAQDANPAALAAAVEHAAQNREQSRQIARNGCALANKLNWTQRGKMVVDLIEAQSTADTKLRV